MRYRVRNRRRYRHEPCGVRIHSHISACSRAALLPMTDRLALRCTHYTGRQNSFHTVPFRFFYDNFGFFRSFLMKSRKGGTSYQRLNFVDLCYSRRRSKIHQERVSSMSLVLLVYQFGSSFSFVYLLACCLTPRSTPRRPDDNRRSEPIRIVCHAIAVGAFDETAQCELRWPRIVVRRASAASNNYITWPKAAGRLRSVHDLMKVVFFFFLLKLD